MAVIIDMDMPKCCGDCPLLKSGYGHCELGIKIAFLSEKASDCPLKSADIQPVIHAKWIDEREESLKCSNCKGWIYKPFIGGSNERTKHYSPNYCAFCGARMDEGGSRS